LSRTNGKTKVAVALACASVLAASASLAQAQSGGTTTTPTQPPPPPSGGTSWTVYKKATWYGPGFWGRKTACGMVLQPTVIGTAHKGLPCGTSVTFQHKGRSITATVIDRGPYRKGFAWDLTKKTAKKVGFLAVGSGRITATVTPAA
jgi:rare lipoprotein A